MACPPPTTDGVATAKRDLMTALCELFADTRRNAILHIKIAARKCELRESRGFDSRLNIHPEIDYVRNELRVRLRLIETAHDAECDPVIALGHEARNIVCRGRL